MTTDDSGALLHCDIHEDQRRSYAALR